VRGSLPCVHALHLPLPAGESALIGLVAAVVVMVPLLWAPVEHFSTMTHEGAHALLAVILGLTVTEIVLDRHSEGKTSIVGEGLRGLLVLLIGYLGPSLFGLGAARLISLGYPVTVLWMLVLLLVLVLFLLGRSFGLISVAGAIALFYVILRYAHTGTEVVVAYAVTWLLLLSGLRTAIGHAFHSASEDAGILRRRTHLPRILWSLLWVAGTLAALVVGGKLLVLG
jgi:Peptidase M50B-like